LKIRIPPQTPDQDAYAADLFSRIRQAALLRPMEVTIGDWRPEPKACHANVTTVCQSQPDYKPVRGWLYFDFAGALTHVKFLAHSAVRAPNGELWDITPTSVKTRYPFIAAAESEDEYAKLVEPGVIELGIGNDGRRMRRRSIEIMSPAQLEAMPTRSLLGRLQRLRECEDSADRSDLDSVEIAALKGINFKADPLWSEAYDLVKTILNTREHVPRPRDRRKKGALRSRRRKGSSPTRSRDLRR